MLFSATEAAALDHAAVLALGRAGLAELAGLSPAVAAWVDAGGHALFAAGAAKWSPATADPTEAATMTDAALELVRLACPALALPAGLRVLEPLVRIYRLQEVAPAQLAEAALPCHGTATWCRLASLLMPRLGAADHAWRWVIAAAAKGTPVDLPVLARALVKEPALVAAVARKVALQPQQLGEASACTAVLDEPALSSAGWATTTLCATLTAAAQQGGTIPAHTLRACLQAGAAAAQLALSVPTQHMSAAAEQAARASLASHACLLAVTAAHAAPLALDTLEAVCIDTVAPLLTDVDIATRHAMPVLALLVSTVRRSAAGKSWSLPKRLLKRVLAVPHLSACLTALAERADITPLLLAALPAAVTMCVKRADTAGLSVVADIGAAPYVPRVVARATAAAVAHVAALPKDEAQLPAEARSAAGAVLRALSVRHAEAVDAGCSAVLRQAGSPAAAAAWLASVLDDFVLPMHEQRAAAAAATDEELGAAEDEAPGSLALAALTRHPSVAVRAQGLELLAGKLAQLGSSGPGPAAEAGASALLALGDVELDFEALLTGVPMADEDSAAAQGAAAGAEAPIARSALPAVLSALQDSTAHVVSAAAGCISPLVRLHPGAEPVLAERLEDALANWTDELAAAAQLATVSRAGGAQASRVILALCALCEAASALQAAEECELGAAALRARCSLLAVAALAPALSKHAVAAAERVWAAQVHAQDGARGGSDSDATHKPALVAALAGHARRWLYELSDFTATLHDALAAQPLAACVAWLAVGQPGDVADSVPVPAACAIFTLAVCSAREVHTIHTDAALLSSFARAAAELCTELEQGGSAGVVLALEESASGSHVAAWRKRLRSGQCGSPDAAASVMALALTCAAEALAGAWLALAELAGSPAQAAMALSQDLAGTSATDASGTAAALSLASRAAALCLAAPEPLLRSVAPAFRVLFSGEHPEHGLLNALACVAALHAGSAPLVAARACLAVAGVCAALAAAMKSKRAAAQPIQAVLRQCTQLALPTVLTALPALPSGARSAVPGLMDGVADFLQACTLDEPSLRTQRRIAAHLAAHGQALAGDATALPGILRSLLHGEQGADVASWVLGAAEELTQVAPSAAVALVRIVTVPGVPATVWCAAVELWRRVVLPTPDNTGSHALALALRELADTCVQSLVRGVASGDMDAAAAGAAAQALTLCVAAPLADVLAALQADGQPSAAQRQAYGRTLQVCQPLVTPAFARCAMGCTVAALEPVHAQLQHVPWLSGPADLSKLGNGLDALLLLLFRVSTAPCVASATVAKSALSALPLPAPSIKVLANACGLVASSGHAQNSASSSGSAMRAWTVLCELVLSKLTGHDAASQKHKSAKPGVVGSVLRAEQLLPVLAAMLRAAQAQLEPPAAAQAEDVQYVVQLLADSIKLLAAHVPRLAVDSGLLQSLADVALACTQMSAQRACLLAVGALARHAPDAAVETAVPVFLRVMVATGVLAVDDSAAWASGCKLLRQVLPCAASAQDPLLWARVLRTLCHCVSALPVHRRAALLSLAMQALSPALQSSEAAAEWADVVLLGSAVLSLLVHALVHEAPQHKAADVVRALSGFCASAASPAAAAWRSSAGVSTAMSLLSGVPPAVSMQALVLVLRSCAHAATTSPAGAQQPAPAPGQPQLPVALLCEHAGVAGAWLGPQAGAPERASTQQELEAAVSEMDGAQAQGLQRTLRALGSEGPKLTVLQLAQLWCLAAGMSGRTLGSRALTRSTAVLLASTAQGHTQPSKAEAALREQFRELTATVFESIRASASARAAARGGAVSSVLEACHSALLGVLDAVLALMPAAAFVDAICELLQHPDSGVRRRALSCLNRKLLQEGSACSRAEVEQYLQLVPKLLNMAQQTELPADVRQTGLLSLHICVQAFASDEPASFVPAYEVAVQLFTQQDETATLRASAVLLIAHGCQHTPLKLIGFVPRVMSTLLQALRVQPEPATDAAAVAERPVLQYAMAALAAIAEGLPQFIAPYLPQVLATLLQPGLLVSDRAMLRDKSPQVFAQLRDAQQLAASAAAAAAAAFAVNSSESEGDESDAESVASEDVQALSRAQFVTFASRLANEVLTVLCSHVPARTIVPALADAASLAVAAGPQGVHRWCAGLQAALTVMKRSDVRAQHVAMWVALCTALDLRWHAAQALPAAARADLARMQLHAACVTSAESAVIQSAVALAMRLSETQLRPLLMRASVWRSDVPREAKQPEAAMLARRISFYCLVYGLTQALRAIFVPFWALLWKDSLAEFAHLHALTSPATAALALQDSEAWEDQDALAAGPSKSAVATPGADAVSELAAWVGACATLRALPPRELVAATLAEPASGAALQCNERGVHAIVPTTSHALRCLLLDCWAALAEHNDGSWWDTDHVQAMLPCIAVLLELPLAAAGAALLVGAAKPGRKRGRGAAALSQDIPQITTAPIPRNSPAAWIRPPPGSWASGRAGRAGNDAWRAWEHVHLLPFLRAVASVAGSLSGEAGALVPKKLSYTACLAMRDDSSRVRMLALASVACIFESGGPEVLAALPAALPFIAEALEDVDPEVVALASAVVKALETVAGEPLTPYLTA